MVVDPYKVDLVECLDATCSLVVVWDIQASYEEDVQLGILVGDASAHVVAILEACFFSSSPFR